jgi:hypothetical protein
MPNKRSLRNWWPAHPLGGVSLQLVVSGDRSLQPVVLGVPFTLLAAGTLLLSWRPAFALLAFPAVIGWSQLASP